MRSVIYLLAISHLGGSMASFAAGANVIPAEIEAALKANANALSPIEVKWTRSRHSVIGQDQLMKILNYEVYDRHGFLADTHFTYFWQDRMAYGLEEGFTIALPARANEKFQIVPTGFERAFNLDNVYMGDLEKAMTNTGSPPLLSIDSVKSPKARKPGQVIFVPHYFWEAGYWVPWLFRDLGQPAEHLVLWLIQQGAQVSAIENVQFDGDNCIEIRCQHSGRNISFVVDPKFGYAVRRRIERFSDSGKLVSVTDVSDFTKLREPSLWFPKRCDVAYHAWRKGISTDYGRRVDQARSADYAHSSDERPLFTETLILDAVKTTPIPLQRFMLKYTTPGTSVADSTLPEAKSTPDGRVYYHVPANLDDLQQVIDQARKREPRSWRGWLIALNIVAVVLLILVIVWRKRVPV